MSEQNPETKKVVKKKAVKKAAPAKKAAPKKAVANKEATGINKEPAQTSEKTKAVETTVMPAIESIVEQMNKDRDNRDKQISSLIKEVREGFGILSEKTSKQSDEHEKEMTGLYQSLQNVFGKIKESSEASEDRNLAIFKSLSDSIMMDHENSLKEVHEQEKLADKKIQQMDRIQAQRARRNRFIAVPGVIIAITGIIYMFYVVSIMESAMTSMSLDMHQIQQSVGGMTDNIGTISRDTSSMSSNLQALNGNTMQMSRDLNVMTNNVGPAMKGIRDVMPWAP